MKTKNDYTVELATKIKSFGFDVYLSSVGNYGFFTDGNKLISFQIDYFFFSFSANHKSINLGSGYRLTEDDQCLLWDVDKFCTLEFLQGLLNCKPYISKKPHEKFVSWTTLEEHLSFYNSSSKYIKL